MEGMKKTKILVTLIRKTCEIKHVFKKLISKFTSQLIDKDLVFKKSGSNHFSSYFYRVITDKGVILNS